MRCAGEQEQAESSEVRKRERVKGRKARGVGRPSRRRRASASELGARRGTAFRAPPQPTRQLQGWLQSRTRTRVNSRRSEYYSTSCSTSPRLPRALPLPPPALRSLAHLTGDCTGPNVLQQHAKLAGVVSILLSSFQSSCHHPPFTADPTPLSPQNAPSAMEQSLPAQHALHQRLAASTTCLRTSASESCCSTPIVASHS